jgi:sec-independent protein translocase protein TatA
MPFVGAHLPELLAVILLALLIFGPRKLPELGSSIGKAIKEFQRGIHEVADPIKEAGEDLRLPPSSAAPALPPLREPTAPTSSALNAPPTEPASAMMTATTRDLDSSSASGA